MIVPLSKLLKYETDVNTSVLWVLCVMLVTIAWDSYSFYLEQLRMSSESQEEGRGSKMGYTVRQFWIESGPGENVSSAESKIKVHPNSVAESAWSRTLWHTWIRRGTLCQTSQGISLMSKHQV